MEQQVAAIEGAENPSTVEATIEITPKVDNPPEGNSNSEPTTSPTEEISQEELDALIADALKIVEEPTKEGEKIPEWPQFPSEKKEEVPTQQDDAIISEVLDELDTLVTLTVSMESEKATLQAERDEYKNKVDFVDTAFDNIKSVIGEDIAEKLAKWDKEWIPEYLIPWNMEKVLSDKILWPLVLGKLKWESVDIPKMLRDMVSSNKSLIPAIENQPNPQSKNGKQVNLMEEVAKRSQIWF